MSRLATYDRTLGFGYDKSSIMLFCAVIAVLLIWRAVSGTVSVDRITTPANEFFYWLTILVSNTLGTALGDFTKIPGRYSSGRYTCSHGRSARRWGTR